MLILGTGCQERLDQGAIHHLNLAISLGVDRSRELQLAFQHLSKCLPKMFEKMSIPIRSDSARKAKSCPNMVEK
jgi:hypothetical protein